MAWAKWGFSAAICAVLAAGTATAQDRAGRAMDVQNDAFQALGAVGGSVKDFDEIFTNARVYTKQYGSMVVDLEDGTKLTVAPNASIVIDEYVYAASGRPGRLALSLTRGALRMVSGRMAKESYVVNSPVANIGIRGTTFWLNAADPDVLEIWTIDGVVSSTPADSDEVFVFEAPAYARCTRTTCERGDAPPVPATYPLDPTSFGGLGEGEFGEESESSSGSLGLD